jgi:hypothetical protein
MSDECPVDNPPGLCWFNQNLHNLRCEIIQIGDNKTITFQEAGMTENRRKPGTTHMPEKSTLFETIIPASLIVMGLITLGLILFAAGVLLGFIKF